MKQSQQPMIGQSILIKLLSKHALEAKDWISWAAYNAVKFGHVAGITPSMLFPLFREPAHSTMMIYHEMNVIIAVINHLNPGQTPIMAVDQPLFTIAKTIQWKFPDTHGENKFVVILGAMHTQRRWFLICLVTGWKEAVRPHSSHQQRDNIKWCCRVIYWST